MSKRIDSDEIKDALIGQTIIGIELEDPYGDNPQSIELKMSSGAVIAILGEGGPEWNGIAFYKTSWKRTDA